MLQFDAEPIATSIPFFVNGTEFLSLNRQVILGDIPRGRRGIARAAARWAGTLAPAKFERTTGPRWRLSVTFQTSATVRTKDLRKARPMVLRIM
jgi:hypothetical protein